MGLTNEELIGRLQPEVRILPENHSPRCLGSESMARGVRRPGKGGSRAPSRRDQGSDRPPAALFTELVSSLIDNVLRAQMEKSDQKARRGSWLNEMLCHYVAYGMQLSLYGKAMRSRATGDFGSMGSTRFRDHSSFDQRRGKIP